MMRSSCHHPSVIVLLAIASLASNVQRQARAQNVQENIRLGALFDGDADSPLEASFKHAINMVNDDRSVLIRSRLNGVVNFETQPDSFKTSKKICQMVGPGMAAIFGPQTGPSASHVQSMAESFHLPHIETRWEYSFAPRPFSINIHPHPAMLSKAYADLIDKYGWKSLVVIYENEESLIRVQEVIKYPKRFDDVKVTLRQLDPLTDDYRPLLKEIKKSSETRILLDCAFEKIEPILKQANEIGLITDYYNYLITSLDLERLDLSAYKYENVNVTGFRIVDTQQPQVNQYLKKWSYQTGNGRGRSHPLFSENVLMYDAVRSLAKSIDDLSQMEGFRTEPLNCGRPSQWRGGAQLADYIKRVEYTGLTGEVYFDLEGFRTNFKLDLLEKQRDNMIKTGVWLPETGVNFTLTQTETEGMIVEKLQNKTLRVTTTTTTPFVIQKKLNVPKEALERMSFEEKYEGFVIDMVKELAKKLKFKYKFHIVGDGKYGSLDETTGEWNGMIRELQDQKADIAVIDLSITTQRQKAVDFTMPYMNTGVGILYKKKAPPPPNLFSFLSPLSIDVWIYMTTAYLATSILMFLLARISPYEWDNPHPCKSDPDELETQFNLINALWFGIGSLLCQGSDILPKVTLYEWEAPHPCISEPEELENLLSLHNCFWHNWGSLMQQGSDIAPKAISTRMVAGMWWFFTLIMISSYTANLAAFLTAAQMKVPINSADDLAKQTKIKYGTYCCGSTNAFFKGSTIATYQKLNAFMESAKPSVYTSGNSEGIERVRKEDGFYAFFMEAAAIEYHVERKCDLTQIGGLLDSKGYGIALPPNSPYTSTLSAGVLRLQESGVLQKLKIKWWKEMHGGGNCAGGGAEESGQLGLPNLGGVFIVLLGGMIVSCFIAVAEFVWEKRLLLQDENQSLWQEMWKELKFALDLRAGDSKPIPKEGSSSSDSKSSKAGSKSLLNEESGYGEEKGKRKDEEDPYTTFNDNFSTTKSNKSKA